MWLRNIIWSWKNKVASGEVEVAGTKCFGDSAGPN